jgi:hypothetical protein
VSPFEDNPLQDTDAVNLIRASTSYGFIIPKAVIVDRFSSTVSISTSGSDSILTMLGIKLLALVVNSGDTTGVFASINQKLKTK